MDIAEWRDRINEIDTELVRLLNDRAAAAVEIGHVKRRNNQQIYDPQREREIIERAIGLSGGPLGDDAIRRLFERIIDESRRLERIEAERNGEAAQAK